MWLWFGYELRHVGPYFLHILLLSSGKYVNREWKIQECKWYRRINHIKCQTVDLKTKIYMNTAATNEKLTKQSNLAGYYFVTELVCTLL